MRVATQTESFSAQHLSDGRYVVTIARYQLRPRCLRPCLMCVNSYLLFMNEATSKYQILMDSDKLTCKISSAWCLSSLQDCCVEFLVGAATGLA